MNSLYYAAVAAAAVLPADSRSGKRFDWTNKTDDVTEQKKNRRKNKVYIKRNFLNLTIRLKIITSRLFLSTLNGQGVGGESASERWKSACDGGDRFAREIFYGLLASGAEKGNVVAVI